MSEVIVRMEMPEDCYECPMYDFGRDLAGRSVLCCNAHFDMKPIPNNGSPRPSWCPIIGVLPEQKTDDKSSNVDWESITIDRQRDNLA